MESINPAEKSLFQDGANGNQNACCIALGSSEKSQFHAGAYVSTDAENIKFGVWLGDSEICIEISPAQAEALADQLKSRINTTTHIFVPAQNSISIIGE